MPLILSRAKVAGRAPVLGLVGQLNRPIATVARSHPVWNGAPRSVFARRYFNNEAHETPTPTLTTPAGSEWLSTPQSIEDILLQKEFEEHRNIRRYLRKWQEVKPNILDPVRDPNSGHTFEEFTWTGNMINLKDGEQARDLFLRRADDSVSEFADFATEGEAMKNYLEPGDLVAFKNTDGTIRLAIYVQSIKRQQQFYTRGGLWRIGHPLDVDFVVKGFVPPEAVAPLIPYFPDALAQLQSDMQSTIEGGIPREVGADLIRLMNDFGSQAHELYRVNNTRFDHIYDIVADDHELLHMTIEELACKGLEIEPDEVNDVIRFAVHQAVRRFPFLMDSDRSSPFTDHYVVYPWSIATILNKVTIWYREHSHFLVRAASRKDLQEITIHPLQKFIAKAQQIIRQSRRIRSPTVMGNVGPSSPLSSGQAQTYQETPSADFDENDKTIIRFLQLWCTPPFRMTSDVLQSAGSHILRATRMYAGIELNSRAVSIFLQELGVFTPWENVRILDHDMALPGHGLGGDEKWNEVLEACKELITTKPVDKMQTLRRDWGDLPVYCIDAVEAQEIDDGISLERIPGSDDTFWIRVHIANPSAFIDSKHTAMEYAASRLQTLYVPERTYPMLPKTLTQEHFSLGPGRPSLTFSAKMNLQGEVLETDVCNGTVQNVVYITHEKLRRVFGVESSDMKPLVVGGKTNRPSRAGMRNDLTSEEEETFHTLRKLMLGFREQRLKHGAIEWAHGKNVGVSVNFGDIPSEPSDITCITGRHIKGDPVIKLHQHNFDPHEVLDISKNDLVSLLMNLACWVSAKWCAERNIPAVFDGTYYHPEYPKLTNENISEYGGDGFLSIGPPKGVSTSRPIPHVPLGLDAYVKSTSPLRRYTDLIAHYQIEAALRFEHEHNRRIDASNDSDASVLPFTHESVEEYISRSRWKRTRLHNIDRNSKQFWACMLLFRAFYFAECKLPETFECLLHKSYSQTVLAGAVFNDGYMGVINSLGVRCSVALPTEITDVDIFDIVEAKITGVDLGRTLVLMEATRVVEKFQRKGGVA
ncbi:hypothetical protein BDV19DRAFT_370636 [Aspergillus venezuelensis]